jgi:UDP-glucose:(heptosyl)LPS alpha-1,3-glucosyltransferase
VSAKPVIAVVSPFLDKRHGTERCVAEQIERLAEDYEIHLYSSAVQDVDLSKITWHRVPLLRRPHLASYFWFFTANQLQRWWDRRVRKLDFDLVFSPGINCLDADVIGVHIVFAEFYRLARRELGLRRNPLRVWPWLIHRKLTYRLFVALENRIYTQNEIPLTVISHKMEGDLARCFKRKERLTLLYHAVNVEHLNPARCQSLRGQARRKLQLPERAFTILIVGNDWKKKGLPCLVEAVASLRNAELWILVRGEDASHSCRDLFRRSGLQNRVAMLPSVPEIEWHYAAADLYVGPSIEDSFAMPPLEAMACGIPSIVSSQAGVSEVITDGVDGFILDNPTDSNKLANLIALVYSNKDLRRRIGKAAAETARQYTWDRNAEQLCRVFQDVLRQKECPRAAVASEEPLR